MNEFEQQLYAAFERYDDKKGKKSMDDKQFRLAVFRLFMSGAENSSAKEIATISGCHERHVYSYLRANNNFPPNGIDHSENYRGTRKVTVYSLEKSLLRGLLASVLKDQPENLVFEEFIDTKYPAL